MENSKKINLVCAFAGVYYPDYWGGHHLPHVSVPAYSDMNLSEVKANIQGEIDAGAVMGSDVEIYETDAWHEAATQAIEAIELKDESHGIPFPSAPHSAEENRDDWPYAIFVFVPADEI